MPPQSHRLHSSSCFLSRPCSLPYSAVKNHVLVFCFALALVWVSCLCACRFVCECMQRTEIEAGCPLAEPELTDSARPAGQPAPGILLPTPPSECQALCMGGGDLNPRPHVMCGKPFVVEPPPHPRCFKSRWSQALVLLICVYGVELEADRDSNRLIVCARHR